jgi:hypothetical protein
VDGLISGYREPACSCHSDVAGCGAERVGGSGAWGARPGGNISHPGFWRDGPSSVSQWLGRERPSGLLRCHSASFRNFKIDMFSKENL